MSWCLEARHGEKPWTRGVRLGSAVIAMAIAAGCATTEGGLTKDSSPEVKAAAVKERSSARWEAIIKGDKDAAYAFLSPGSRQLITLDQYRGRPQAISYRAVQIDHVSCEAEVCQVSLLLTYDYLPAKGTTRAKGITTYLQEVWVLEDGQAWYAWRPQ